nr:hypothetical protein [Volvox reticuliferus]
MLGKPFHLGAKMHVKTRQITVVRCAASLGPRMRVTPVSRRVGLLGGLATVFLGSSPTANAELVEGQAQTNAGVFARVAAVDAVQTVASVQETSSTLTGAVATLVSIASGSLAAFLGFQLNEQKQVTFQVKCAADMARSQCDQLTAEVAALTEKLAVEKDLARVVSSNFRNDIAALEEELDQRQADLSRAQQDAQAAESRATATSAQLQAAEEMIKEARIELAAAVAVQKETSERHVAAMTRSHQLSMALAREKAVAEKVQADAKVRLEAALKAQAAAEEAGLRARTELARTRSRVTRLEADIVNRTEQLVSLEQNTAIANAHVTELRSQLDTAQLQLMAANGRVAELEIQKSTLEGERRRVAAELEAERCHLAELKAANNTAAQDNSVLRERTSGLEEELSRTTKHLHAYKAELHAETATRKALQVQVAALQERVAQGTQQLAAAEATNTAAELRAAVLGQQVTELQSQVEQADARAVEAQASRSATSIELAAAISQVQDLERQMDRLAGHLEKNEAELEAERSARHELCRQLNNLQEVHLKLEATAKSLKDSQEATARELVCSQGKLRELEARAEKQREKAQHYKQEAECATSELVSVRGELGKAHAIAAAANAKVVELTEMIVTYEARSKDLHDKVQDAVTREAALVRAADTSKTALTKMEHDAQAIRREMAENSMRAAQMKQENVDLQKIVAELQVKLNKAWTDAGKSTDLEQQVAHLQDELAVAQGFQAQLEELRQQLAQRDRQLAESVRNISRLQAMAGRSADGEIDVTLSVGSTATSATYGAPKCDPAAPKRTRATTAKNTARRETVKKAIIDEVAVAPAATEPTVVEHQQPESTALKAEPVKHAHASKMKCTSRVNPMASASPIPAVASAEATSAEVVFTAAVPKRRGRSPTTRVLD